jgi:peroxiredoxin
VPIARAGSGNAFLEIRIMKKLLKSRAFLGVFVAAGFALVSVAPALAQNNSKPGTQPADKPAVKQTEKKQDKTEKKEEKADKTVGVKVGDKAPDFKLTDTEGKEWTLAALTAQKKIVVLEWFNPDCPFVKKHHEANKTVNDTFAKFKDKNVVWFGINSAAAGESSTGTEKNSTARKDYKIAFPILLDGTSSVAMAYGAKRTPETFIVGPDGIIAYHGSIDSDASPNTVGKNYVEAALKSLTAGETIKEATTTPTGCPIKYASKK